jgi:hypothetical protein
MVAGGVQEARVDLLGERNVRYFSCESGCYIHGAGDVIYSSGVAAVWRKGIYGRHSFGLSSGQMTFITAIARFGSAVAT